MMIATEILNKLAAILKTGAAQQTGLPTTGGLGLGSGAKIHKSLQKPVLNVSSKNKMPSVSTKLALIGAIAGAAGKALGGAGKALAKAPGTSGVKTLSAVPKLKLGPAGAGAGNLKPLATPSLASPKPAAATVAPPKLKLGPAGAGAGNLKPLATPSLTPAQTMKATMPKAIMPKPRPAGGVQQAATPSAPTATPTAPTQPSANPMASSTDPVQMMRKQQAQSMALSGIQGMFGQGAGNTTSISQNLANINQAKMMKGIFA